MTKFEMATYTVGRLLINGLRKDLFAQKCLSMENIPPTQAALLQHANRAVYQCGIWSNSLKGIQSLPSPDDFGWTNVTDSWTPLWTLLPEAAKACRELLKCGCKAEPLCSRKCRCQDAGLPCTALCQCADRYSILQVVVNGTCESLLHRNE